MSNALAKPQKPSFSRFLAKDIERYARLGLSHSEIAALWEVAPATVSGWIKRYKGLRDAYSRGRSVADAKVAAALYKRATGFSVTERHVTTTQDGIILKTIDKHFAPDVGAIKFWLTNRQPEHWRDRVEAQVDGSITVELRQFREPIDGEIEDVIE